MGRPPSNGGPSFRFNQSEISEMEAILQAHKTAMPARELLVSLAEKFSNSGERKGKIEVQMKQVWNWFQNRRYAIRAKAAKSPGKLNITPMTRDDSVLVKGVPQATQPHAASSATVRSLPQAPQHPTGPSAAVRTFSQAPQHQAAFSGRVADNSQMEYEAKSARDGAWYDVSTFLSHRALETGDPEVLVRFAGFGAEEDEWVNVRKNVRQRSLPCESSECVAVLPADLILCFQEGKEQALYFDAHVLDAQRRRHDVRGCRCRFLVRYDHDQSEEIVALRKICRRPETDYRLQQLHAVNDNHNKTGASNIHSVSTLRVYPPAEVQPKQHRVEPSPPDLPQKRQRVGSPVHTPAPPVPAAPPANVQQNQHEVQPAPSVVEPMPPAPSVETLLELQKVEPMVAEPSGLDLVKSQHGELTVPDVQPVVPETVIPSSAEVDQEPQTVETTVVEPLEDHKAEPVPSGEASLEPLAMGPAEVPEELNEAQPAPTKDLQVKDGSSDLPPENSKVAEAGGGDNVGSSDLLPESGEGAETLGGNKAGSSDLPPENGEIAETGGGDKVGSSDLPPENGEFAETLGGNKTGSSDGEAEDAVGDDKTGSSDLPPEIGEAAETVGSSDLPPEKGDVAESMGDEKAGSSNLPPESGEVAETVGGDKAGSSDLPPENGDGAETVGGDKAGSSDLPPEKGEVAESVDDEKAGSSSLPLENAGIGGDDATGDMEEG